MIKLIMILALGLASSGCASLGEAAKGFGDGISSVYRNDNSRQVNCNTTKGAFGTYNTSCN